MPVKKKSRFDWTSIPIMNYYDLLNEGEQETILDTFKQLATLTQEEGEVEFHRNRLGKQKLCWTGEYRFWVWEGDDWRVFTSNVSGMYFEVKSSITTKQAWAAFMDYLGRVKLVT